MKSKEQTNTLSQLLKLNVISHERMRNSLTFTLCTIYYMEIICSVKHLWLIDLKKGTQKDNT